MLKLISLMTISQSNLKLTPAPSPGRALLVARRVFLDRRVAPVVAARIIAGLAPREASLEILYHRARRW